MANVADTYAAFPSPAPYILIMQGYEPVAQQDRATAF